MNELIYDWNTEQLPTLDWQPISLLERTLEFVPELDHPERAVEALTRQAVLVAERAVRAVERRVGLGRHGAGGHTVDHGGYALVARVFCSSSIDSKSASACRASRRPSS